MILDNIKKNYYNNAVALAKNNRISKAIEALEKAAAINTQNPDVWNLLGLCRCRLGDFHYAKKAWEISLTCNQIDNPASDYLSTMQEDEFKTACSKYNKALQLAKKNKLRTAARILKKLSLRYSDILSFSTLLALCVYGQGKRKKALLMWCKVLEMDRDNPVILTYLSKG